MEFVSAKLVNQAAVLREDLPPVFEVRVHLTAEEYRGVTSNLAGLQRALGRKLDGYGELMGCPPNADGSADLLVVMVGERAASVVRDSSRATPLGQKVCREFAAVLKGLPTKP